MKASHTLLTLGSQLCCHVKAIKTSNMKLPLRFTEIMEGSNINHKTELIANVRECFQESQHWWRHGFLDTLAKMWYV